MNNALFAKIALIALLTLILMVPLALIQNVISARAERQTEVEQTIAETSAGAQTLLGPVLVVPYTETVITKTIDEKSKLEKSTIRSRERIAIFPPEAASIEVAATTEEKFKGLYKALVIQSEGQWVARFKVPANLGLALDPKMFKPGSAYLAFGFSDPRGILGAPSLTWNDRPLALNSGSRLPAKAHGIHAEIGQWDASTPVAGEMRFGLRWLGTTGLWFAPVGEVTKVKLTATWPHPNFGGSFLPRDKSISEQGFSAHWEVSRFATRNGDLLNSLAAPPPSIGEAVRQSELVAPAGDFQSFGVKFIEPVNIYLQAERAVKYGILFVALTFAGFFLTEILRSLRIHPVQYGLVGLALAVFFLLTIGLSEHLAFGWAYLAAASGCVGLLTFYLAYILGSRWRGLAFGGLFGGLYALLYVLLLSEDNALVLGSLLVFAALAAVMVLTRKVDWYHLAVTTQTKA